MRATSAILFVIALQLAPAIRAAPRREDSLAEATRLHAKARQEMRALEFEGALPLLLRASRLPGLPSLTRAELQADLGITYVNLGDTAKARAAFQLALETDPLLELPARTPPKIRQLYDAVRSERAAALAPAPAPAPTMPSDSSVTAAAAPPPPRRHTLPLILGGVAAAALATGIITGSSSASAARELGAEPHDRATVDSLRSRQQTLGIVSVVSYSAAALAAGSAAGLLLWPRSEDRSLALSGAASRDGATVVLTYGF